MPRLPDRFDLWVRRARACPDPARQLDYVLGALVSLPAWYYLNIGTADQPRPATTEVEGDRVLLVFSDAERVPEMIGQPGTAGVVFGVPTGKALADCVTRGAEEDCHGLFINPGEDGVLVGMEQVRAFAQAWLRQRQEAPSRFWIPNLTTEEEDFWQEHGL